MWGPAPGLAAGQAKILYDKCCTIYPSTGGDAKPFFGQSRFQICGAGFAVFLSPLPPLLAVKFPTHPSVQIPHPSLCSNALAFKFPTPPSGQIEFHTPPSNLTSHPSLHLNYLPLPAVKFHTPPSG